MATSPRPPRIAERLGRPGEGCPCRSATSLEDLPRRLSTGETAGFSGLRCHAAAVPKVQPPIVALILGDAAVRQQPNERGHEGKPEHDVEDDCERHANTTTDPG